ncbi:MAG: NUDIX domain-containing protein [Marinifilaceae bacterium]|jgi:ADP-ribose pyrophosphatase YjhB (NUDIX family)|nr:NUDIX domain-containing protein [Marinifilaceae bacterium]
MYKVFFKERLILLSDSKKNITNNFKFINFDNSENLKSIIHDFLHQDNHPDLFIYSENLKSLFKHFKKSFKQIKAAGGLVFNSQNDFLAIYRLNKWDLPKGKIEKGETKKTAAIREVEEECGISDLVITKKINTTYHIYKMDSKFILKYSYWYKMKYDKNENLIPQTEEDITDVKWINLENKDIFLQNTYPAIKDLLSENLN